MKHLNQSGSHVVAVALLVLVLGVLGYTGYRVQQSYGKTTVADKAANTRQVAPESITNASDLQQTGQVLDDSAAELDANLDDSTLNADLDSML